MSGIQTIAVEVTHKDKKTKEETQLLFMKLNLPPRFTLAKLVSGIDTPEEKFPQFYQTDQMGRVKYSTSGKPLARQFGARRFVREFIASEVEDNLVSLALEANLAITGIDMGRELRETCTIRVEPVGVDVNHIGGEERPKKRVRRGGRRRTFELNGAPVDMGVHTRKVSTTEFVK